MANLSHRDFHLTHSPTNLIYDEERTVERVRNRLTTAVNLLDGLSGFCVPTHEAWKIAGAQDEIRDLHRFLPNVEGWMVGYTYSTSGLGWSVWTAHESPQAAEEFRQGWADYQSKVGRNPLAWVVRYGATYVANFVKPGTTVEEYFAVCTAFKN